MEEAQKVAKWEPEIPLDVTFSPIATGNEKYINWGRLNSVKPDPEANLFKKWTIYVCDFISFTFIK